MMHDMILGQKQLLTMFCPEMPATLSWGTGEGAWDVSGVPSLG